MTETTPYRCTECGEVVSFGRTTTNQLIAFCECEDRSRLLKVGKKTPEVWETHE